MTAVTPPSSKVRRPVTASGILTLTQSPLLFKGKAGSAGKRTPSHFRGKALKKQKTSLKLQKNGESTFILKNFCPLLHSEFWTLNLWMPCTFFLNLAVLQVNEQSFFVRR